MDALRQHMTSTNVRASLRRAYREIEDVCENAPVSESDEKRLAGIAEQLRYFAEGGSMDPEASASPDPDTLDTIRDHLVEVSSEAEGDVAAHLERVCDELLFAISVLYERLEKQRRMENEPG